MEIKVFFKKTEAILPFDYFANFHSFIVKLLGDDKYGMRQNDYVYSNIRGWKPRKDLGGFVFEDAPYFNIRTNSEIVWGNFTRNLPSVRQFMEGFDIDGWTIEETNLNRRVFETCYESPILIGNNKKDAYAPLSNEMKKKYEQYLKNGIFKAAESCGVRIDENLSIRIMYDHGTSYIKYRGIHNIGRRFRLYIECDENTKEFILTHGLGRSCGCGFGYIL